MRLTPVARGEYEAEGYLTTYNDLIHGLLATFASDDHIAEAEGDLHRCVQTDAVTLQDYSKVLSDKVYGCGMV